MSKPTDLDTYKKIKKIGEIADRITKLHARQAKEFVKALGKGHPFIAGMRATVVLYRYEEFIQSLRNKLRRGDYE